MYHMSSGFDVHGGEIYYKSVEEMIESTNACISDGANNNL